MTGSRLAHPLAAWREPFWTAGRLSSCYFEMDGARELYQAAGDNTCVIFDTTFNKNSFGMRLFFFSTLTLNGLTKVRFCTNVDVQIQYTNVYMHYTNVIIHNINVTLVCISVTLMCIH